MAEENNNGSKLSFISKKEVQFIAWLFAIIMSIAVPFITYGNKIQALETEVLQKKVFQTETGQTLEDIKIKQAEMQKDIDFIREILDRNFE